MSSTGSPRIPFGIDRMVSCLAAILVLSTVLHAFPITIDARDLSSSQFLLFGPSGGLGPLPSAEIQALDLTSGEYFFLAFEPFMGSFTFVVTADGTVNYMPTFDAFLSGRGTSTLSVRGLQMTVDAHELFSSTFQLGFRLERSSRVVQTFRMLPGGTRDLFTRAPTFPASISLLVNADGTWDYPSYLDTAFEGRGTSHLVVHGFPITVDLSPLTVPNFATTLDSDPIDTNAPVEVRLLPGVHSTGSGGTVSFQVTDEGKVDYDVGLDNVFAGQGTTMLRVNGVPIEVDARGIDLSGFSFQGGRDFSNEVVQTLHVTPGKEAILLFAIGEADLPHYQFSVTVLDDGSLDYWQGYDTFLSGRGTNRLTIGGFPVTIDATAVLVPEVCLGRVRCFSPAAPVTLSIPPGSYVLSIGQGGRGLPFRVNLSGKVDFMPVHESLLSGSGTSTLTVQGFLAENAQFFDITFDVTGGPSANKIPGFHISNGDDTPFFEQTFSTDTPHTVTLRNGLYRLLVAPDFGGNLLSSFLFAVTDNGTVDFYPSFDGFLSGRGTPALHLNGFPVVVDPRPLDLPQIHLVSQNFAGNQSHPFLLLPAFRYEAGFLNPFFVTEQGQIDYLPSADSFFAGRGSDTLTSNGLPVTIDPRGLSHPTILDIEQGLTLATTSPVNLRRLPTGYRFVHSAFKGRFDWTFRSDGTVDFVSQMDAFATGRGTSTLTLSGAQVTVDATALSIPTFNLTVDLAPGSGGPVVSKDSPQSFSLLPGELSIDSVSEVPFRLLDSGRISLFPTFASSMSGEGTNTLIDVGLPVEIDARALESTAADFVIGGRMNSLTRPTNQVAQLRLNPGLYGFLAGDFFFFFLLNPSGLFDYASSFDGQVVGRGSNRLVIGNTPAGLNVAVEPVDSTTGTEPVSLTFESVTEAGNTTLTTSASGAPPPTGFKLGNPPTYYEITTTAGFTGNIQVCITYDEASVGNESQLHLFHLEGGSWVDSTVSLDTTNNIICASVTSVSPFAVLEAVIVPVGFEPPLAALVPHGETAPLPDHAFKQGSTLPLKLTLTRVGAVLTPAEVGPPRIVALVRSGDAIDLSTIDPDAGQANDSGLLFRFSEGHWVYNLSTAGLSTGTYAFTIETPDGQRFDAAFVLR